MTQDSEGKYIISKEEQDELINKYKNKSLQDINSQLASEWHPTKNGDLKPNMVGCGSHHKIWWLLPYDDPITNKHFNFEWQAIIYHRNNSSGCPFLSSQAIWIGFNDLETKNPNLTKEWNYEKNYPLTPKDVMPNSNKKVWWIIPYQKENGEIINLEWEANINDRNDGKGCPYIGIAPKKVLKGFNDLATTHPQLAKQWSSKNKIKPTEVMKGSNKKYIWELFHTTQDNKTFLFEWESSINHRNDDGSDCPYLCGKKVHIGFNDLESNYPNIAKEWDYDKNYPLTPRDVVVGSQKKYWWIITHFDEISNKDVKLSWKMSVYDRVNGKNCPYLGKNQFSLLVGFNDLATVNPQLASEWHPTKNGNLKPIDVQSGSPRKVWWIKKILDEDTNIYYDVEWKAVISSRNRGQNCPLDTASKTVKDIFILLKESNIDFQIEYIDYELKNKKKLLFDFYIEKNIVIEFDGKQHFSNDYLGGVKEFIKRIENDNIKNEFCKENKIALLRIPYIFTDKEKLKNIIITFIKTKQVPQEIIGFYNQYKFSNYMKDIIIDYDLILKEQTKLYELKQLELEKCLLKNTHPELAKQWHPTKNKNLSIDRIFSNSNKKVWWYLPYDTEDGKHFDFEWQATVSDRVNNEGCPFLSNHRVWPEFNDLATINPQLASEWHPTKNGNLTPLNVSPNSNKKVWWLLPYDTEDGRHFDFEWQATVSNRNKGDNCPYLSGKKVYSGFNDLATIRPDIAKQWHPTKNGSLTPYDVTCGSNKYVWWLENGTEYQKQINHKTRK